MTSARQLLLFTQWQFRRNSTQLPLLVIVQVFLSIATVLGYGMLVGTPSPEQALYLATGAPTITLVMVGFVMTPQVIAQSKTEGSLDWMRTLPMPRGFFLAADLLMWTVIALPGMVLGLAVGAMHFDLTLSPTPWIVPAALLVSLTSASVGYAIACLLQPTLAMLVSQVLVFVVLLFSPVSYPASRMPLWLQSAHEWLPIEPMSQLIRGELASNDFSVPTRSVVVLSAWCVAAVVGALATLRRRA